MIEKIIGYFSPQLALERLAARKKLEVMNSGYSYHGASGTKKALVGWQHGAGGPDDDITLNLEVLRSRSRDLFMGNPLASGALKTDRTNVVGSGLRLNPQIDADFLGLSAEQADEWELITSREFALWAESKECDAARMQNFFQMQQLAFLSAIMSGDVFVLLPVIKRKGSIYDLRVQLIEADRVCNPHNILTDEKTMAGIEVGEYGEPVAYYIAKHHPLSHLNQRVNEWKRVEAFGNRTGRRNVLHLLDMERPGQRRGVPMLAPVIESFKQLGRYSEAELMAAVVSGLFTVAITSDAPEEINLGEDAMGGIVTGNSEDDATPDIKLGNGTVVELAPGEKLESVNPARPNAQFDPFVLSVLRQIGASLEIPMELLVKHFTASYSASRAALLEAWKFFRRQRSWLASDFTQPIYEEWLAEAVAKGRIKAPGFFADVAIRKAYCGAEWNGPTPGQIDPLKEVIAAQKRVTEGFSTRQRETAELTGGDWNQNYRQRVREEKMMREGELLPLEKIVAPTTKGGDKT